MPRYFFDIHQGDDVSQDPHGIDLPDVRHVWEIAVPMVDEIAVRLGPGPGVSVVVRDGGDLVVYRSDHHGGWTRRGEGPSTASAPNQTDGSPSVWCESVHRS